MERRALLEHAIATLIGNRRRHFPFRRRRLQTLSPAMPPSVPSTLLERRPDIAAAERRGLPRPINRSASRAPRSFANVTINLSGGTQDTGLSLLKMRNSIWSVGPAVTLPIFDGGARWPISGAPKQPIWRPSHTIEARFGTRFREARGCSGRLKMVSERGAEHEHRFRQRTKSPEHIARALS